MSLMPHVTFALFAFNQASFIREAVNAALAQEYSQLTILISDDCSSDDTFNIIKSIVSEYNGPHKIILNRNERNLGVDGFCLHVNKVFELIDSDLIVVAAGDDISLPNRTKDLVNAWVAAGMPSGSLHSAAITISDLPEKNNIVITGRKTFEDLSIREAVKIGMIGLLGCTHAITKDIFIRFGPLPISVSFEDRALAFRSFLEGKIIYCDKVLVRYRVQDNSLSGSNIFKDNLKWQKWINNIINLYKSYSADLKLYEKKNEVPIQAFAEIDNAIIRAESSRLLVDGSPYLRFRAALNYAATLNFTDRLALLFKIFSFEESFVFKILSKILKIYRILKNARIFKYD